MNAGMLKLENIQILDRVNDWKEAVAVSVKPLVEGNYVEQRYVDGIIQNTLEMGPYYIIADGVALLHGRPEQGVKHQQIGVTVMRQEVTFVNEDAKARLLIVLAAENADSHIDAMRELAEILMDEEKVQKIIEAPGPEDVWKLFLQEHQ